MSGKSYMREISASKSLWVHHLNYTLLAFQMQLETMHSDNSGLHALRPKYLTSAMLFWMLLLPMLFIYLFILMHLSVFQNVVVILYFTSSAATAVLLLKKTWRKVPGVPKDTHVLKACTTNSSVTESQPLQMLKDPSLQQCYANFRPDAPFILLPDGWLLARETKRVAGCFGCLISSPWGARTKDVLFSNLRSLLSLSEAGE